MKKNKKILIAAAVSGMLSAGMFAAHAAESNADGKQVAAADKSSCNGKNCCKGGKCSANNCKSAKCKKGSEQPKSQTETVPAVQDNAAAAAAAPAQDNDTNIHDDPG